MAISVFPFKVRGTWAVEVRYHGKLRRRSFATEAEAREKAAHVLAEFVRETESTSGVGSTGAPPRTVKRRQRQESETPTFGELVAPAMSWLTTEGRRKQRGRKGPICRRTARGYGQDLDLLVRKEPAFVGRPVSTITTNEYRSVENRMCTARRPSSRQNLRSAVAGVFAFAVHRRLRPDNPCELLEPIEIKAREQHRTRLKPEEKVRFLRAALERGDREGIALVVALTCALRPEEILGLREGDVELRDWKLRVACSYDTWEPNPARRLGPTKGRTILPTPLHEEVAPMIANLLTGDPAVRLFPFRYERLRKAFQAVKRAAGIERRVTLRNLRTTAITEAMEDGKLAPMKVCKIIARHASLTTTEKYYTLIDEEEAATEAASKLRPLGLATPLRPGKRRVGEP